MKSVFLHILPLLLGAAISPVAAIGMIAVLTSKKSPRLKGLAYLLGASLPLFIIGVPGIFLFANISFEPTNSNVSSTLDLVAGLLLLALAIKNVVSKPTAKRPKAQRDTSLAQNFLLGSGLMIVNFSTIILFIPAIKDIALSTITAPEKLAVLVASVCVTMSLITLPLVIATILPQRSQSILERLRVFMTLHNKSIMQAMLIVFGIYLLAKGFGIFAT